MAILLLSSWCLIVSLYPPSNYSPRIPAPVLIPNKTVVKVSEARKPRLHVVTFSNRCFDLSQIFFRDWNVIQRWWSGAPETEWIPALANCPYNYRYFEGALYYCDVGLAHMHPPSCVASHDPQEATSADVLLFHGPTVLEDMGKQYKSEPITKLSRGQVVTK